MARQTFRVLLTLSLFSHHVLSSTPTNNSNTFEEHQTRRFVGWRDSPSERGTITLLWTCLSTIVVSTWTLLHLNVPGSRDSAWQKTKRKIKWMGLTVLFPELTFSKAVCELQMAVEDLHGMKAIEEHVRATTQWKVEFGPGSELLYNLFQYIGFKKSESRTCKKEQKQELEERLISEDKATAWTLTHSYFANMGGLVRRNKSRFSIGNTHRVTAYAIAECCARTSHSPLLATTFDEDDIMDKSKADWLSKSIAIAQVCWLIISIIVRKIRSLPISQIEVCTAAFAVLGTATWLANWSKPKDVDRAIAFWIDESTVDCDVPGLYNQSPYHRLSQPYKASRDEYKSQFLGDNWAVSDDLVRFDSRYPIVASIMALSTAIFGGIHFLAWNAVFPSSTESIIWKAASLLTTAIPLVALAVTGNTTRLINHQIDTILLALKSKYMDSAISLAAESDIEEASVPDGSDFTLDEIERLVIQGDYSLDNHNDTATSLRQFLGSIQLLFESQSPHHHHEYFLSSWGYAVETTEGVSLRVPEATEISGENPLRLQNDIRTMINLVKAPAIMNSTTKKVEALDRRKNIICGSVMIITGIIYLIARLMILALALAALRKQDERLYVETWTRYLPNIS